MSKKTIRFKNDVPKPFLELFEPKKPFHNLVKLAKKQGNTLDLHFRVPQSGPSRATLYLGTSKVVDIHYYESSGDLKIEPQKSDKIFKHSNAAFKKKHPSAARAWGKRQPQDKALRSWTEDNAGEDLVSLTLSVGTEEPKAKKFIDSSHEGFIQASLAKRFDEFTVIDRESIVSFPSQSQKTRSLKSVHKPISDALKALEGTSVPTRKTGFGGKLDALAIDNKGRVLAIEVKGGYDTAGMGWTPAQVAVYKRIIEVWIEANPEAAREALAASLEQRKALGLGGNQEVPARGALKVVPVIVIGKIESKGSADTANQRMKLVRRALKDAGEPLRGLEIKQIRGKLPRDVDPKVGLIASRPAQKK